VRVLAKRHQHVRRQRADFHHKTALDFVRAYDTIYVEAIQPANLSRRPAPKPDGTGGYAHNGASQKAGLNKSIQDAGWRQFLSILAYKAACAGKRVEAVPPASTSQDCSGCGERIQIALSVRTHVCTHCGLILPSSGADSAFGDSRGCLRGGTENPSGCSPCGVSGALWLHAPHHPAAGRYQCS
jgi:putative transposase